MMDLLLFVCTCCAGLAGATADVHCFDVNSRKWSRSVLLQWCKSHMAIDLIMEGVG